ncbi:UPF0058 family protein [Natrinema zhouii]|uniref:UPF0058 family protein n=1 Tax=Natrinema zhouii TaxID=1710539 RepID=A0A7D6GVE5_9EURY|nr:UPF0058 family protein [Natrinema zhouii]QLK25726.1 UPF0058 family protein [Natrinema zhouii]
MREQELINLHALLFEVRASLEREDGVPSSSFEDYDAQPVRPAHIHRRKEAHERAIDLLLNDIVDCVQRRPPPDQTIPT